MIILAGLGNPGRGYAAHRHNIGFMAVERIAAEYGFGGFKEKPGYALADGRLDDVRLVLVKPLRYMNRSGVPLRGLMDFYKTAPQSLTVIHDDIDLAPGKVRVKTGGGHGGHNGLRDIDRHIGVGYRRVRVGIGRPPHAKPGTSMVDSHVLSNFTHQERSGWVDPVLACIARHVGLLCHGEDNAFMTAIAEYCPPPAAALAEKNGDHDSNHNGDDRNGI